MRVEIVELLVSPLSRYEGRPSDGPLPAPPGELVDSVAVREGLGLVGDRYFGKPAHRRAAVTVMATSALELLPAGTGLAQTRRNILVRGYEIDPLVGSDFALDSGSGPVRFRAHRPANPCGWMDEVIGAGSRAALRGHGGVRCEPLSDGELVLGPAELTVLGGSESAQQPDPAAVVS